jgi:uncharacterized protein (TIGR03643 family)
VAHGIWLTIAATMAKPVPRLSAAEIARIIEMAWDDRPPFNAVLMSHGLSEGQLVQLLKRELTPNAFKVWSARAHGTPGPRPKPPRPGR